MKENYQVYRTVNSVNGKYYIGVHNGKDPYYLGSGTALSRAVQKYGRDCFIKTVLLSNLTQEQAFKLEQKIITQDIVDDPLCYNLTTGGIGGGTKSKQHIAKLAENNRKKAKDPKFIKKLSKAKLGDKNPAKRPDVKRKLRQAALNREKLECPHCGRFIAINTAHQWHFNNCKVRKEVANA